PKWTTNPPLTPDWLTTERFAKATDCTKNALSVHQRIFEKLFSMGYRNRAEVEQVHSHHTTTKQSAFVRPIELA
ncbi:MAG: hypothetical protein ACKVHO_24755, partial [Verrucomicrobiia bacterium]